MNQKALLTVICMLVGILGVALPAYSQPVMRNGVEMIDLGEPPLTPPEMNAVMNWIAIQVGAIELPYCYRQSYGNGAGEPYTCKPGLERIGLLCYPPCKPGYHHSTANLCTVDSCPPGFTDSGAFCQKPGPYGRGAGYAAWDMGKCASENPQGCEWSGAIIYPKCKAGFHPVGCCICSPDCPEGYADTGTGCTKPVYGVGAGEALDAGVCAPGLEKDPTGALCYPTCKADFHMVGPVCWQNCPAQHPTECAAGCATTQSECANATVGMVISPVMAAVSLATFGEASAATTGARAAEEAAQTAEAASKLRTAYNAVKTAMTAVKGNVTELVGGAQNLAKLQAGAKIGGKIYTISTAVGRQVDLFSREFADNFAALTSPEIAAQIDRRFGKDAAYQIKRQWGIQHLALMLDADGFKTAQNAISIISTADPTGLVGVANAFLHPICKDNTPFPTVHPLYNH